MDAKYHVDAVEYKIIDNKKVVVINGWSYSKNGESYEVKTTVNSKKYPAEVHKKNRPDVNAKLHIPDSEEVGFEVFVEFDSETKESDIHEIELYLGTKVDYKRIFKMGEKRINKMMSAYNDSVNHIVYSIDDYMADGHYITLMGWVVNVFSDEAVDIAIFDEDKKELEIQLTRTERKDVFC